MKFTNRVAALFTANVNKEQWAIRNPNPFYIGQNQARNRKYALMQMKKTEPKFFPHDVAFFAMACPIKFFKNKTSEASLNDELARLH